MITAVVSERDKNMEFITKRILDEAGVDSAIHVLSEKDIGFLKNPNSFASGIMQDDYQKIELDIMASDAVILSCFSFFGKMDGRMSNFLDRTYGLLSEKRLKGKYGIAVCISEKREDTYFTLSALNNFFLHHEMMPVALPFPYSGIGISSWAKLENEIMEDYYSLDASKKLGEKLKVMLSKKG